MARGLTGGRKRATMSGMNNKFLFTLVILIGLAFVALAFVYWLVPAGSLPGFLPGYIPGASSIHLKHGIGSLILGLALFVFAWFQSGKNQRKNKMSADTEPTIKQ